MAQYTPSSGDYCRPLKSPWGAFPVITFPAISTAAAIEIGTMVTYSTGTAIGGVAQQAVLPSTGAGGLASFGIVGITAEKSSAFTSSAVAPNPISIWEANPMVEFKAVSKGAAQGSSSVGLRRALAYDSTLKITYVDLTASTATDWRVIVTKNLGAEGDSGGYVAFRFLTHGAEQQGSTVGQASSQALLAFYS